MKTAYVNGIIYTGDECITDKSVITENGIVVDIVPADEVSGDYKPVDLKGANLAPAFIDMQIYGGNGKMFSQDLSTESLQSTYEYCLSGGATHFMITMATNTIQIFLKGIELVKKYWEEGGKGVLGLHLEGPYINPIKKGAHVESCIKKPTREEVKMLLREGKGVVKMMTLAPEQCDMEIIELLMKNDVIVSAGHTNATYHQGIDGFNNGIPAATHLFNAMSPFQSREPGMVGAIYDHDKVTSSVVCDGVHVDFAAIRISKQIMKERLFYITDAVAEVKEGAYQHIFRGDRYTLPDGTLSGSSLTMMKCVENGVKRVGIPLEESLRMASTHPARLLPANAKLGKIAKGYNSNFVVFNDAFEVMQVLKA
jgi:N-acetylglucosamine-6-phosphate deacetylase